MNLFLNILGNLVIVLFGFLLVKLVAPNIRSLAGLGLGYLIGSGIFTLILFLGNLMGLPFRLSTSVTILISSILVLLLIRWIKYKYVFPKLTISIEKIIKKVKSISKIELLLILFILFLITNSLIANLFWPVKDWDSLVLYDFRAKTFVATGYMQDGISRGYFFGYPLYTSLLHTWLYLMGSKNPMIIYTLIYLSFLIVSYFIFRNDSKCILALFFTSLLAISPEFYRQSQIAYTNLPYTVFYVLGAGFAYLWARYRTIDNLILSALLIGLSTWVRSVEPFWIIATVLVFFISFLSKKYFHGILFVIIILLILLPWKIYEGGHVPQSSNILIQTQRVSESFIMHFDFARFIKVINFFFESNVKPYLLVFFVYLIMLIYKVVIYKKQFFQRSIILMLITLNLCLLFITSYALSFYYNEIWEISGSFSRLSMLFPPLVVFALAEFYPDLWENIQKNITHS
ncbi:MAG: hypothetical protein QXU40_03225 [Candidatus Pacearchaeota archaeon]